MHRQMKMENFLRLPPLPPVIPGIVVDDDVTNDERRVDDVFIATTGFESISFVVVCCEKKTDKQKHKTTFCCVVCIFLRTKKESYTRE